MNTLKRILSVIVPLAVLFTACDPNKELYENLDNMQRPFKEEGIEYTLVEADYNRFAGFIRDNSAFSDTFPAMDFIPDVLKVRFVTLRESSSVLATFNHFLLHPDWWDSGFGYELTEADYNYMQTPAGYFTSGNPPQNNIPFWLLKEFPQAEADDQEIIIYNYLSDGEIQKNQATYEFDGENWVLIETVEDIPYVGYELTPEDYENFGGSVANFGNFSTSNTPETHLPVLLKNIFPFALEGDEQVVKYRYHNGSQVVDVIDKYEFDGMQWVMIPYIEERTEQYIFGELGWAFDPTVSFQMGWSDYMYLAEIDPIPHETFNDFGYYYGSSAFFRNFDIRLIARRLNRDAEGNYRDPELGQIYDNEGSEAAMAEMLRRINEEGIIKLLQHKFPDAQPQVGGIDVHFIVRFETFEDGFIRNYPEAEYICVAAGDPPQFELIK